MTDVRMWRIVREHPLPSVLIGSAVASLALLGLLLVTVPPDQRNELLVQIGNGLTQLLVVVLLGAALKLLGDRYQAQQQAAEQRRATRQANLEQRRAAHQAKAAQDRAFRQDKYDRLVRATNRLRRVPILIDADRSVATWNQQMLAVVDVSLDLRMIKHQIYSSQGATHPPFERIDELTYLFELMYHYTDWVTSDLGDRKKELSDVHDAAQEPASEEARSRLWNRIRTSPPVADMLRTERADRSPNVRIQAAVRARRAEMRTSIGTDMQADLANRMASLERWRTKSSWLVYQEAESLALASIAAQE